MAVSLSERVKVGSGARVEDFPLNGSKLSSSTTGGKLSVWAQMQGGG